MLSYFLYDSLGSAHSAVNQQSSERQVLTTPALKQMWLKELTFMSNRINDMRVALRKAGQGRESRRCEAFEGQMWLWVKECS